MINNSYKISIVIDKDTGSYYAYCPALKGCHSQGNTFEEVNINIREAIELYLKALDPQEIKQYLSKEIYTTALEVSLAGTA